MKTAYANWIHENHFEQRTTTTYSRLLSQVFALISLAATSASASSSAVSSQQNAISWEAIMFLAAVVPMFLLSSAVLTYVSYHQRRGRMQRQAESKDQTSELLGELPFVGEEPELEAEERLRHEVEGTELSYKMDGDNIRREIEGYGGRLEMRVKGDALPSPRHRQELRGEEHAKRL